MSKWLYRAIGVVLFLVILQRMDYAAAMAGCRRAMASSPWLAGVPLLFLPTMALKAWRWGILLHAQGIAVPFSERFTATLSSFFAAFLTPGKVGGLLKVAPIMQRGHSSRVALVSVLLDRLLDLGFVVALACVGVAALPQLPRTSLLVASAAVTVPVGLVSVAMANPHRWLALLARVLPASFLRTVGTSLEEFARECGKVTLRHWGWAALSTALAWGCYYLEVHFLCAALAIPLSLIQVVGVGSVVMIASTLPITVMGLGTREASLLFLFQALGLPQTAALSLGLMLLTLSLAHTFFGFVAWWHRPLVMKMAPSPRVPGMAA